MISLPVNLSLKALHSPYHLTLSPPKHQPLTTPAILAFSSSHPQCPVTSRYLLLIMQINPVPSPTPSFKLRTIHLCTSHPSSCSGKTNKGLGELLFYRIHQIHLTKKTTMGISQNKNCISNGRNYSKSISPTLLLFVYAIKNKTRVHPNSTNHSRLLCIYFFILMSEKRD